MHTDLYKNDEGNACSLMFLGCKCNSGIWVKLGRACSQICILHGFIRSKITSEMLNYGALFAWFRESTVDEPMPLKRKATGDIYSKYSSESEDSESILHSGSAPRKVSLFNKKLEGMHLDLANTKRFITDE